MIANGICLFFKFVYMNFNYQKEMLKQRKMLQNEMLNKMYQWYVIIYAKYKIGPFHIYLTKKEKT